MPSHCPECRHPVPPEARACPNCPASWDDESEDGPRPKRRSGRGLPTPVIFFALLAGVGLLFWKGVTQFLETADSENSFFDRTVKSHLNELDPKVARATV